MLIKQLTIIALCAMLLSGCKEQQLGVNKPAPELAVLNNQGQKMTLESLRGQPVVVEFWSSTCGACLAMMKQWQQYAHTHPGKMQFIGVGIKPHPQNLKAFADKLKVNLPIGLDQLDMTKETYQVSVTPTTFFIDRQGILRKIHVGYSENMDLDHYVNLIK